MLQRMLRTSYLEFSRKRIVIGMVADSGLRQMEWRDKVPTAQHAKVERLIAEAEQTIREYIHASA